MKYLSVFILTCLLVIGCGSDSSDSDPSSGTTYKTCYDITEDDLPPFAPNYLVVRLKTKIEITRDANGLPVTGIPSLDGLTAKHNCISMRNIMDSIGFENLDSELGMNRDYIFSFREGTDILTAMCDYLQDPNVEDASPDSIMELD